MTYLPMCVVPDWSNAIVETTTPDVGKNEVPFTAG